MCGLISAVVLSLFKTVSDTAKNDLNSGEQVLVWYYLYCAFISLQDRVGLSKR